MSLRADTSQLISGCLVASLYPGHGVRGDAIPTTGSHGPAPLYAWLALPADAANEYRWAVTTPPTVGDLVIFEDGSYTYTPPPATVDLLETFDFDAWENGALLGSATYTITIGSPGGSVISAAAGTSTAATMAGASTAAAAITAAAGAATASTLTGIAGTGSDIAVAAGASTASAMVGASTAEAAIASATGAATAATLVGSATGDSSAISAAAGVASAQILVGSSFAQASIAAASGASTGRTLFSTAAAPADTGLYTITARPRHLQITAARRRLEIKP